MSPQALLDFAKKERWLLIIGLIALLYGFVIAPIKSGVKVNAQCKILSVNLGHNNYGTFTSVVRCRLKNGYVIVDTSSNYKVLKIGDWMQVKIDKKYLE